MTQIEKGNGFVALFYINKKKYLAMQKRICYNIQEKLYQEGIPWKIRKKRI